MDGSASSGKHDERRRVRSHFPAVRYGDLPDHSTEESVKLVAVEPYIDGDIGQHV